MLLQHMKKTLSKEDADWEIYEESLNHKPNEKREKPAQKYIEVLVSIQTILYPFSSNRKP